MQIRADGFVLRPWKPGDEAALVWHANNRKISRRMRDSFPHPYTQADAEDWIRQVQAQGEPPCNFAIVLAEEPIGGVGLTPQLDVQRRTAEVGYWVSESHWGVQRWAFTTDC